MKEKLVVLFGGKSVEHDISVITAVQVMSFLDKSYDILPIYMDKKGVWWTADNLTQIETFLEFEKRAKNKRQVTFLLGKNVVLVKKRSKFVPYASVYSVLNCCHGNIGEDGAVQGIFKSCEMAYTCSNVTSSALCMDKAFMKEVLLSEKISTPKFVVLRRGEKRDFEFPAVVKPANLGSSIGISICHTEEEYQSALQLAFEFDDKVVVEEYIQNLREFNCAAFEYRDQLFTSSVCEVKNKSDIYTFEDKYLSEKSQNGEVEDELADKIKTLTKKVYKLFDCGGLVRVDFLFDNKKKKLYVNEINSIPGSMGLYLFKNISYAEILTSMIEESRAKLLQDRQKVYSFKSDAIDIFAKTKIDGKGTKIVRN